MSMDLDAIQQMFFQESEEGLQSLEACFAQCGQSEADGETINTIFRAVHSIKGGAGAFGHEALQTFAHHYEHVLDQLRSGKLCMTPALLDVLLAAFDVLSDHVAAARGERGTPDDAAVLAQLAAAVDEPETSHAGEGAPDVIGAAIPVQQADDFDALLSLLGPAEAPAMADPFDDLMDLLAPSAPAVESTEWWVSATPGANAFANGAEPLLLLRELGRMGATKVTLDAAGLPGIDALEPEQSYLGWQLALPGSTSRDDIEAVFEFVAGWDVRIGTEPHASRQVAPSTGDAPLPQLAAAPPQIVDVPSPAMKAPASIEPVEKAEAPASAQNTQAASAQAAATIRVELDKLDRLVNLVGELVITQAMLAQRLSEHSLAGLPELTSLENLTRELQDSAMSIRAQPMKTVFNRVPRIIRELEADTGKRVRLQLDGEMTEVDKTVVERIGEPLTHLIRNAVDHGIERPDERVATGKSSDGFLRVGAEQRSGKIVITVADDGRGIDRKRVKEKAIERGIVPPDVVLTDDDIDNLIFAPGFSTAETVSNISGRGVGMDVVRRNVQALGGRIGVSSKLGEGTCFTLSLPLTLAVLDGMIVRVGDQTFVIPLGNIVESLRAKASQLNYLSDDAALLDVRGSHLPVLPIGALLGIEARSDPDSTVMIVLETDAGPAVVMVDAIEDQRQVVVKSLEANYQAIQGVCGATILGDGRVALILDVEGMLARCRRRPALAA